MNRRTFFKTSAGLAAVMTAPDVWSCSAPPSTKKHVEFTPYRPDKTLAPVTKVTPDDGFYIHTFYDVTPFSPSHRFLAVNKLPFQDHDPVLGETCDICVIDLQEKTIETVYTTKGWGFQLGANLNWGATDRHLYTNDVIGNEPVCVRIDLETRETKAFAGPMYHIAPDESRVMGFPLDLINATQRGYGVPETPDTELLPPGAADDQGLWSTDLAANEKTLFMSCAGLAAHVPNREKFDGGTFYFFHTKFNKQNTRIMQVFRCMHPELKGWNPQLFTFNTDGSNVKLAVTHAQWAPGGHHPNWHPDGEHLIMNLKPDGETLRFVRFKYDGSDFTVLSENRLGSGHPSITPDGQWIAADAYPGEPVTRDLENDEVPIRLFNVHQDSEENICTIYTLGKGRGTLRCDPHPAWSPDYKKVAFNGAPGGVRQVFVADLSDVV